MLNSRLINRHEQTGLMYYALQKMNFIAVRKPFFVRKMIAFKFQLMAYLIFHPPLKRKQKSSLTQLGFVKAPPMSTTATARFLRMPYWESRIPLSKPQTLLTTSAGNEKTWKIYQQSKPLTKDTLSQIQTRSRLLIR